MDALEAFQNMNKRSIRTVDHTGSITSHDPSDSQERHNKKDTGRTETVKTADLNDSSEKSTADIEAPKAPERILVTDLSTYAGDTLGERLESFTQTHPVAIFSKSWCLFSIDAQNFMLNTFSISVHVIELDTHHDGKAIHKYLIEKTGQETVPVIFIKGDFLGGFEDVNAMYASGKLEREYLTGLSQADQCEDYLNKAHLSTKPLFWYPEKVNGHVVRITGMLTCFCSMAAAGFVHLDSWGAYIAYAIAGDFLLRLFAGARLSPLGRIAMVLAMPMEPQIRVGRPKQFAAMCGFTFALLGSIFFSVSFPYHNVVGSVFMGGLAIATGAEGFLDFCVGCFIFKYLVKFGLVQT